MVFECESVSTPINDSMDGFFCTDPKQQIEIIRWIQKVKANAVNHCKALLSEQNIDKSQKKKKHYGRP